MGSCCACLSKADAPADVSNTNLRDGSSFEPLDKGIAEIAALANNTTTTLPAPAAALRVSAADNEAVREDDPLYSIEPAALVDGGGVQLMTTSNREASHSLVVHPNVTPTVAAAAGVTVVVVVVRCCLDILEMQHPSYPLLLTSAVPWSTLHLKQEIPLALQSIKSLNPGAAVRMQAILHSAAMMLFLK